MQTGSYIRKYYCICIACDIKASHITKKHASLITATPTFANEYTRWQKRKRGCFKGSVLAHISLVGDGSDAPSARCLRPFQQEWEELDQMTLRPRAGAVAASASSLLSFNLLFRTSSSVHPLPHPASDATRGSFYSVPHRKLLASRSSRPTTVFFC